jgi:uncharacterized protein YjbJ (UPF0337 family)
LRARAGWLARNLPLIHGPRSMARLKKSKIMSTRVKGNWNIAKGKMKQALARLTHDNLQFVEGKADELVGRIQKRSHLTRRKIEIAGEASNQHFGHR